MGSDWSIGKHNLVDRCCNGACFGFGFVVATITLITMFWLIWFYFGLTFIQVSDTQRRALVDYSYVPPSTSSPNRNSPPEVAESSLNQISKLATVSSSFPRIDPTEVLEKKSEILNGRQASPAKGDFAARSRNNKTSDTDIHRTSQNDGTARKANEEVSASLPIEQDPNKSTGSNRRRGTQIVQRRNITSNSDESIIPTRAVHSEFGNEKTTRQDQYGSTVEKLPPIAVVNSRLPDDDFTSANPNSGSNKDIQPNKSFDDRDDSLRNRDKKDDHRTSKGDIRIFTDSQPSSMDGVGRRDRDRDDRLSLSNSRRREEGDKYDDRDGRYQDRIPYDDRRPVEERRREDDKYRPIPTRNNRNRDEERYVDDRYKGDIGKYDDKIYEDRYRDRIRSDPKYPEERRRDIGRYDDRDRRLDRDRIGVSLDDEYLERYPADERRYRENFRDRLTREHDIRDRLPDDERRSIILRDEERSRRNNEKFDESLPKERGRDDRYKYESDRHEDDKLGDYDRRKIDRDEEYRYSDRYSEDRFQPNRTGSRTDDRYNYRDRTLDSSRYNSRDDPYPSYSNTENSRSETKVIRRDSLTSSRADYRPNTEEIDNAKRVDSTRNDRHYLSSSSRPYASEGNLNRDLVIEKSDRDVLRSDEYPRRDRSDRIVPSRVKDDRYVTRIPDRDSYDLKEGRDRSYPDDVRRPTIIDSKYDNDDRSSTSTHTRLESSRNIPSIRRDYYPTDRGSNSPKSENDEISLERRSYSSEDEYRLSNVNRRVIANQPDRIPYDDRRRDYRTDDSNKKYVDEDEYERNRRPIVRNRDPIPRESSPRDRNDDQYRDIPDRDRSNTDRDRPIDRDQRNKEQDRYNRNRDQFDDRRYEDDKYDRSRDRYDDRDSEDRYIRDRDRYDYRNKDRYDQSRDRYDEERYEDGKYDRNRDRYDESRYDQNRDRYRDEARYDRNRDIYRDDRYEDDRYDRQPERKPRDELPMQDDRTRSRDPSITRSRNTSPSRSDTQEERFRPPSDVPDRPIYPGVNNQGVRSKDTREPDTSLSDYDADRPLSAKDVIDAALRQAESADQNPKKVYYPVFDPRISNLTSSDIIRPSERRGITTTSRRRRKR